MNPDDMPCAQWNHDVNHERPQRRICPPTRGTGAVPLARRNCRCSGPGPRCGCSAVSAVSRASGILWLVRSRSSALVCFGAGIIAYIFLYDCRSAIRVRAQRISLSPMPPSRGNAPYPMPGVPGAATQPVTVVPGMLDGRSITNACTDSRPAAGSARVSDRTEYCHTGDRQPAIPDAAAAVRHHSPPHRRAHPMTVDSARFCR